MKKKIFIALAIVGCLLIILISGASCSSCDRTVKDIGSDINGGLNRTVKVYDFNGRVITTYKGKIDLEPNDSGVVKFELDGKRYMYYNAFVEVIEQ